MKCSGKEKLKGVFIVLRIHAFANVKCPKSLDLSGFTLDSNCKKVKIRIFFYISTSEKQDWFDTQCPDEWGNNAKKIA